MRGDAKESMRNDRKIDFFGGNITKLEKINVD